MNRRFNKNKQADVGILSLSLCLGSLLWFATTLDAQPSDSSKAKSNTTAGRVANKPAAGSPEAALDDMISLLEQGKLRELAIRYYPEYELARLKKDPDWNDPDPPAEIVVGRKIAVILRNAYRGQPKLSADGREATFEYEPFSTTPQRPLIDIKKFPTVPKGTRPSPKKLVPPQASRESPTTEPRSVPGKRTSYLAKTNSSLAEASESDSLGSADLTEVSALLNAAEPDVPQKKPARPPLKKNGELRLFQKKIGSSPATPSQPLSSGNSSRMHGIRYTFSNGYSTNLLTAISQAIQALEKKQFDTFLDRMLPPSKISQLRLNDGRERYLVRLSENPAMVTRMIEDLRQLHSIKPRFTNGGNVATFDIPGKNGETSRQIKFQSFRGYWKFYDGTSQKTELISRLEKTLVLVKESGGNWRLKNNDVIDYLYQTTR